MFDFLIKVIKFFDKLIDNIIKYITLFLYYLYRVIDTILSFPVFIIFTILTLVTLLVIFVSFSLFRNVSGSAVSISHVLRNLTYSIKKIT